MFSSLFIKLTLVTLGSVGLGTGGYFVYKTFFKETDSSQISKAETTVGDSTSSTLTVPRREDSSNTTTTLTPSPSGGSQNLNEGPGTTGNLGNSVDGNENQQRREAPSS